MKTSPALLLAALSVLACGGGRAAEPPVVGVLEQFGITRTPGGPVTARPTYILTDRKLAAPTTFSGLQGGGSNASVICCYDVKNLVPVTLAGELAKYGQDDDFRYLYVAAPTADRRRWTSLMEVLMHSRADPADAMPFSAAVIAARFGKDPTPRTFDVGGVRVGFEDFYRKKTDRLVYRFTLGADKVEFSEEARPH